MVRRKVIISFSLKWREGGEPLEGLGELLEGGVINGLGELLEGGVINVVGEPLEGGVVNGLGETLGGVGEAPKINIPIVPS